LSYGHEQHFIKDCSKLNTDTNKKPVFVSILQILLLSHVRGYGAFTRPAANHETTMQFITHYFTMGFKYKEIIRALLDVHGIKLSLRHL
jgi:hypothetical protein